MTKRLLLALLLLGAAIRAEAIDWTDIWYNISQQGYGYNLVQSGDHGFIYVTFYLVSTEFSNRFQVRRRPR